MSVTERQPHLSLVEDAATDGYLSERDEHLGELFRSLLPEEIADLPFDSLVRIATEFQGTRVHARMVHASNLYAEIVKKELHKEINELKRGQG